MSADGDITGTPSGASDGSVTVEATFAGSCTASREIAFDYPCQRPTFPPPAAWTTTNYYTGASVGEDGWINGLNVYLDREKAQWIDLGATSATTLRNVMIAFGLAHSADPNKIVPVRIYDGTTGAPGALLATADLTMGALMSDVGNGFYSLATFSPAVTLPASRKIFVSIGLTGLTYQAASFPDRDVLSLVSNASGQTTPSTIWERQADDNWYQYTTAGSWNLAASLYVFPLVCD
jgi:hypothetical protein